MLCADILSGCEAHDYWLLPKAIEVDSTRDILSAQNEDEFSQDLFVRYQLDYEVSNLSSNQASEVVVSATSFVNSFERATGQKVWHLDPGQTVQGMLITSQLQLGNSLTISLQCCPPSRCSSRDVICPEISETTILPDVADVAAFCYDACHETTSCSESCPAEPACEDYCEGNKDIAQCRQTSCGFGGNVASCAFYCKDDQACLEQCRPTEECHTSCLSNRAACFKNCLSTWTQCSGEIYDPHTDEIPCAICGGQGLCTTNFNNVEIGDRQLTAADGTVYPCAIDCNAYPASCLTGCENLYDDDASRMACLDRCLQQHLFWCNDNSLPLDYVDSRVKYPCCFNDFCQSTLSGVVNTYDVECFNDTDCSSGKTCSDEGICVSTGISSCSARTQRPGAPLGCFLCTGCVFFFLIRRRRGRHE